MVAILNQPPPKPIRGWISTFKVSHNGQKHGPYHYRCWKQRNKTYKQYIKARDLDYYRAATEAYRDRRKRRVAANKDCRNCIANFKLLGKVWGRLEKDLPIDQEHAEHVEKITKHGPCVEGCPPLRKRRFMDPFLTKLWKLCFEDGVAFAPILRAVQLDVPIEEIEIDLTETYDAEVEQKQIAAVDDAFWRRLYKVTQKGTQDKGAQDSSCI
jgi:hypothetical protein